MGPQPEKFIIRKADRGVLIHINRSAHDLLRCGNLIVREMRGLPSLMFLNV